VHIQQPTVSDARNHNDFTIQKQAEVVSKNNIKI